MIKSIHYMRGIAALMVFFYHERAMLNGVYAQSNIGSLLFSNGYFGVDLFFMISGFVILLSTENDGSSSSFALKRFFRIFPTYWVGILLMIAVIIITGAKEINAPMLLKSLLLIPYDSTAVPPFFGFSLISTAWTLTFEILFYLIFMASMTFSHKYRAEICGSIITITFMVLFTLSDRESMFSAYARNNGVIFDNVFILKILASPMMLEFVFGMLVFKIRKHLSFISPFILYIASLVAVSMLYQLTGHGPLGVAIPCAIIFISAILIDQKLPIKDNVFMNRLGDLSYSFYITHPITLLLLHSFKIPFYSNKGVASMLIVLSICLLVSWAIHVSIEKRAIYLARYLKKAHV
ncbi:acyltransferase [Citrobacter freundii]|nr:acyltransferase [Citrobacter freundii]QMR44498.1 acyltransferase [Citrobacter freundii]